MTFYLFEKSFSGAERRLDITVNGPTQSPVLDKPGEYILFVGKDADGPYFRLGAYAAVAKLGGLITSPCSVTPTFVARLVAGSVFSFQFPFEHKMVFIDLYVEGDQGGNLGMRWRRRVEPITPD